MSDSVTVAHQAPLSMGFFRQECWSRLAFHPPGDFPNPGIKPLSPALQVDSLLLSHQGGKGLVFLQFKVQSSCIVQPNEADPSRFAVVYGSMLGEAY